MGLNEPQRTAKGHIAKYVVSVWTWIKFVLDSTLLCNHYKTFLFVYQKGEYGIGHISHTVNWKTDRNPVSLVSWSSDCMLLKGLTTQSPEAEVHPRVINSFCLTRVQSVYSLTCATVSYAKYAKISIATAFGFISILLQSNQSRNLDAFFAVS